MILYLDTETYSELDLRKVGAYRYAEACEVIILTYALDDEPVRIVDLTDPANAFALEQLQRDIDDACLVVVHNSAFDRLVLASKGVTIPVEKIEDTMVRALRHSLPGALGDLCDVLRIPTDKAKDKAGKALIQLFSKPRPKNMKLRRATRETHPVEWEQFLTYAALDVDAMREVRGRLPRWNDSQPEQDLWRLDQTINDRGIAVDTRLARAAIAAAERAAGSLATAISAATGGAVTSATQRDRLIEYLRDELSFHPEDLRGGTIDNLLKQDDLDPRVREVLKIRRQASATSPAKYAVLLAAACSDARIRGLLQYCGAMRTGRWGGRLFQPQNLPRPTLSWHLVVAGIEAMLDGVEDLLFDPVMDLITSAIRSALVASKGHKLAIADLSNIEGRMLAWLAGETWKIEAFRAYDSGVGHDLYVLAYARSFNVTPEEVVENKKSGDGMMRQIGKVQELALGYQGSIGAFAAMASGYGVNLPEEEVLEIVKAWRRAHPNVVQLWYSVERMCKAAIKEPGKTLEYGPLKARVDGSWMRIRLPSGRYLCYPGVSIEGGRCLTCNGTGMLETRSPDPAVEAAEGTIVIRCDDCEGEGWTKEQIQYWGVNQYTRKWSKIRTYGGKLVENIVQAASRDVFAHGMVAAEAEGYKVCLHVHDELITEVPDSPDYTSDRLEAIMATNPSWSIGLPLAAGGFETQRYRKD